MGSKGYIVDFIHVIDLDYLDKNGIKKSDFCKKKDFVVFYKDGSGEYECYSIEPISEGFINKFLMEFSDVYDVIKESENTMYISPIHPYKDFDSAENNAIQIARNLVEFSRFNN